MNWITEKVNELCGNGLLETAKVHVEVSRGDILSMLADILPEDTVEAYVRDAMALAGEEDEIIEIAVNWCRDAARDVKPFIHELKYSLVDSLESQVIGEADADPRDELALAIRRHGSNSIDWEGLAELYLEDAEIERVIKELIDVMVDDKFTDITAEDSEEGDDAEHDRE